MQPDFLDRFINDVRRVEPLSRARADDIRSRVMNIASGDEGKAFHRHLISEATAFAIALGTDSSDPEAAYQAVMMLLLDVTATLQAISRRVYRLPLEDAPASLAFTAYASVEHVSVERQDMVTYLVREFHSWATEVSSEPEASDA